MTCRPIALLILLLYIGPTSRAQSKVADTIRINKLQHKAMQYIARPGSEATDFDSAALHLDTAYALSCQPGIPAKWKYLCIQYKGMICLEKEEWDTARKILTAVADEFAAIGEVRLQARSYELYGKYLNTGAEGVADRLFMLEKAASLYASLQLWKDVVDIRREVAYLHFEQNKSDQAVAELLQLLDVCQKHKLSMITSVYDVLTHIEKTRGNYNLALHYGLASLKACEEYKVTNMIESHYLEVAKVYYMLDNYEEGVKWHRKSLDMFIKVNPFYTWYEILPLVHGMIKLKRAHEMLQLLNETARQVPLKSMVDSQSVFLARAMCYHALKRYDRAQHYFSAMAALKPEIDNFFVYRYTSLAQYAYETGAYANAKKYARELLNTPEPFLTPANKSEGYYLLFKADSALGNAASALHYLSMHKALNDSIFTDRKEKQTQELLVQYETEKKEKDLQLKSQSIALLQKGADVQLLQLGKAKANRNLALSVAGLLVVITGLLLNQYRLNRRNTQLMRKKNATLEELIKDKDRLITEKVWLLKEVHHRVKNNLQTVLSLLESQSWFVNKEALPAIQDSKNRVYAMSLIHKKLYQSEEVTAINMEHYLKELLQHLRDSMPEDRVIRFSCHIDPIELDVSQAVPVGLIVNEAVTNAVKYAFGDRRHGNELTIQMKCDPSRTVMLTVEDNGKGMGMKGNTPGGLGLRLMRGLTEDIGGTFTITKEQGVAVVVTFTPNQLLHHTAAIAAR